MTPDRINNGAIELLEAGRAREAEAGFRWVIRLQPSGAEAYYNLGIALKDQQRHAESVEAYAAAISARPNFPQAHFNLGRALQMMSDDPGPRGLMRHRARRRDALEHAADHFRRSVRTGERASDSYRSLEEVLQQLGDTVGAAAAYDAYLSAAPHEGLRHRRRVPCARVLEVLAQARHPTPAPKRPHISSSSAMTCRRLRRRTAASPFRCRHARSARCSPPRHRRRSRRSPPAGTRTCRRRSRPTRSPSRARTTSGDFLGPTAVDSTGTSGVSPTES